MNFSVSETLIAVALRTGEISNQSYGKIREANKNLIWIVVSIKGGGEGRGKNGCPLIVATLTCSEIVFQQEKWMATILHSTSGIFKNLAD